MEHSIKLSESDNDLVEKYRKLWNLTSKQRAVMIIMDFVRHNEPALVGHFNNFPEA